MRLFVLSALLLLALVSAQPVIKTTAGGEEIVAQVAFPECQVAAASGPYAKVSVKDLPLLQSPGKPALPFYPLRILLPPNREVKEIVVSGTSEEIPGEWRVRPAAVAIPWFVKDAQRPLAVEDAVYRKSDVFPGKLYAPWQMTPLAGYQVVSINLYPCQYRPTSGRLEFYPKLTVNVTLNPVRSAITVQSDYAARVAALVSNPQTLTPYNDRAYLSVAREDFPYVIITAQSLTNLDVEHSFEYFVNFLKTQNMPAKIVTVAEIYQNYTGKDKADQVRNFIKYAFANWRTRYVLLAGDGDKGSELVPVRRFKTDLYYVYMDNSSLTVHEMMAADYYYCALDGDFDGNKNGVYGEPADNIDLEPEVAVGRAPVDNKTQVNNFVKKTVQAYQHAAEVTTPKVLLLGEHLFSPGQCGVNHNIYGDSFMEELRLGANTHGFYTYGFTSKWTAGKLYDKVQSWGSTDVKRELNTFGACWINHIGHSSPGYNMRLYSSSISTLTNTVPFIYYSQGCNAARFTNEATAPIENSGGREEKGSDCIAEYLVYSERGAFAVIANWSYGLSPEDPQTSDGDTPGASQYFHRYFVDAFFNPAVNMHRIGDMMNYSRVKMNSWLLDPEMQTQPVRWVYYEAHLLGDPYAPLPKR
jgi:hypothetical protein